MHKTVALLLLLLSAGSSIYAGSDLSGVVLDRSSGEPLAFANVSLTDGRSGVITDGSGAFRLELPARGDGDTVVISYVGYKTLRIPAANLMPAQVCYLDPYTFSISEVVVTPLDAEHILRRAYDEFYINHVHRDMATYGYFREQIFDGDQCVRFGEAAFATRFYEKDGKDMAALEPYLARSIDDSTFLKKLNDLFNSKRMVIPVGMNEYQENDMVDGFKVDRYYEFIGDFFFGDARNGFQVDYQLRENYIQNGRESFFITFDIHKKKAHVATGNILIDRETYGIAAFEIQFREQENLTKIILPPKVRFILKILGYGVDIGDYEAKLYNRYENGKWFIGSGVQVIQGGIAKRKEWIRGKIVHEFHAYYSKDYVKPEKTEFKDVRVNDFSSDFWKGYRYSPIQPDQLINIRQIIERNESFSGEVLSERVKAKIAEKERNVQND